MKTRLLALFLITAYLAIGLMLGGCATAPHRTVTAAPAVSTSAISHSIGAASNANVSATTHTQTAIQTVNQLITTSNPVTVVELKKVKMELQTVSQDLQDTQTALKTAQTDTATAQGDADKLKAWGIDQQALAFTETTRADKAEAQDKIDKAAAHENAKERDVVVWAFALAFAMAVFQYAKLIQPPWAGILVTLASIGIGYAIGRTALFEVAKFIP